MQRVNISEGQFSDHILIKQKTKKTTAKPKYLEYGTKIRWNETK